MRIEMSRNKNKYAGLSAWQNDLYDMRHEAYSRGLDRMHWKAYLRRGDYRTIIELYYEMKNRGDTVWHLRDLFVEALLEKAKDLNQPSQEDD